MQCERGDKEWRDSAVAGESEEGDGGKEMGESGRERRSIEQPVCCGEDEKGRDPPKVEVHGDEGDSK